MGKQGPCNHCGIANTPLWRNGPPEKPVLCNACGSRWRTRGTLENYMPLHAGGLGLSVAATSKWRKQKSIMSSKPPPVRPCGSTAAGSHGLKRKSFSFSNGMPLTGSSACVGSSGGWGVVASRDDDDESEDTGASLEESEDNEGEFADLGFHVGQSRKRSLLKGSGKGWRGRSQSEADLVALGMRRAGGGARSGGGYGAGSYEGESGLIHSPSSDVLQLAERRMREEGHLVIEEEAAMGDRQKGMLRVASAGSMREAKVREPKRKGLMSSSRKDGVLSSCQQPGQSLSKGWHPPSSLLSSSHSPLAFLQLQEVLTFESFSSLPEEDQRSLKQLLPFVDIQNGAASMEEMFKSPQFATAASSFQSLIRHGAFDSNCHRCTSLFPQLLLPSSLDLLASGWHKKWGSTPQHCHPPVSSPRQSSSLSRSTDELLDADDEDESEHTTMGHESHSTTKKQESVARQSAGSSKIVLKQSMRSPFYLHDSPPRDVSMEPVSALPPLPSLNASVGSGSASGSGFSLGDGPSNGSLIITSSVDMFADPLCDNLMWDSSREGSSNIIIPHGATSAQKFPE